MLRKLGLVRVARNRTRRFTAGSLLHPYSRLNSPSPAVQPAADIRAPDVAMRRRGWRFAPRTTTSRRVLDRRFDRDGDFGLTGPTGSH